MGEWQEWFFGDFADVNPRVHLKKGTQYPFVEMGIVDAAFRTTATGERRIYKGSGAKFESGDTLFARITPCLQNGKIGLYEGSSTEPAFGSTEFFIFRGKPTISDSRFIYYLTSTDLIRKSAEGSMTGASGRQRADLAAVKDIKIPLPPLPTQKKIAAVLSAYDDLIENNRRRIRILEEMAQNLYREWFVKFRFPIYRPGGTIERIHNPDSDPMVESALGPIPKGWAVKAIPDAIELNPRLKTKAKGPYPYIAMGELATDSMLTSISEYREKRSGSKFMNGDTLFARITPCLENGKTGYVDALPDEEIGFGSTEFIVLRSKTLSPELVYLMARADWFREHAIKSMTGASGRQRVQHGCFDSLPFPHPPSDLVTAFSAIVAPHFREIKRTNDQSVVLTETRDLLLPKLVSGQLDVSELDIAGAAIT